MAGVSLYQWHITLADSNKENLLIYDPNFAAPLHGRFRRDKTLMKWREEIYKAYNGFFTPGRSYQTAVIGITEDTTLSDLIHEYTAKFEIPTAQKKLGDTLALLTINHANGVLFLEDIEDNPRRYSDPFAHITRR